MPADRTTRGHDKARSGIVCLIFCTVNAFLQLHAMLVDCACHVFVGNASAGYVSYHVTQFTIVEIAIHAQAL